MQSHALNVLENAVDDQRPGAIVATSNRRLDRIEKGPDFLPLAERGQVRRVARERRDPDVVTALRAVSEIAASPLPAVCGYPVRIAIGDRFETAKTVPRRIPVRLGRIPAWIASGAAVAG